MQHHLVDDLRDEERAVDRIGNIGSNITVQSQLKRKFTFGRERNPIFGDRRLLKAVSDKKIRLSTSAPFRVGQI